MVRLYEAPWRAGEAQAPEAGLSRWRLCCVSAALVSKRSSGTSSNRVRAPWGVAAPATEVTRRGRSRAAAVCGYRRLRIVEPRRHVAMLSSSVSRDAEARTDA